MGDPTDMSLTPGLPAVATPEQLAAAQAAIAEQHDLWADELEGEVPVPAGDLPTDHNIWPEDAYASAVEIRDLKDRIDRALTSAD
jgi:hypothetical protein